MNELERQIAALAEPVVSRLELQVFDVEHRGGVLRISLDSSSGADLSSITEATRSISRLLDEEEPLAGRYTLEVSSPGLERTLRDPAQFRWASGKDVTVKLTAAAAGDGQRRLVGSLIDVTESGIVIELAVGGERRALCYDDIDSARTVFEWGPSPKPGSPQARQKAKSTKKRVTTS